MTPRGSTKVYQSHMAGLTEPTREDFRATVLETRFGPAEVRRRLRVLDAHRLSPLSDTLVHKFVCLCGGTFCVQRSAAGREVTPHEALQWVTLLHVAPLFHERA